MQRTGSQSKVNGSTLAALGQDNIPSAPVLRRETTLVKDPTLGLRVVYDPKGTSTFIVASLAFVWVRRRLAISCQRHFCAGYLVYDIDSCLLFPIRECVIELFPDVRKMGARGWSCLIQWALGGNRLTVSCSNLLVRVQGWSMLHLGRTWSS